MTATILTLPVHKRRPLPKRVQPGIRRRLAQIGQVLELPADEIERAGVDLDSLIEFAWRTGQSLDWIILGEPRVMIARLARCR